MALPGSYSLKWHGHGVHLNASISGLYRSDAFTDVVVATADGRYFPAHQFVLSACSPYLHKLFLIAGNGSKANAKTVVVLPSEIGHATLGILLQYIYRGEAIVSDDQLPSIMKAAEILEIRGLCQAKEKQDSKTSSSVLKQQNKNSPDLRNNSEVVKPNHRVLIPELKYGSESNDTSTNISCTSRLVLGNSSRSSSDTTKRTPVISSPPEKKKQKRNTERPLFELKTDSEINIDDSMIEKIIVAEEIHVKDEPVDWEEPKSSDENSTSVKQEVVSDEEIEVDDTCYVALTCDLCQETFSSPALWVRHIEQTHPTTALASGKQRSNVDDDSGQGEFTPLHCELCQQVFTIPADWVRHIKTHSEEELAVTNGSAADALSNKQRVQITCPICGKVLQSKALMQIHERTHTGERAYLCKICGREFNIKSNFLRHMRALHNQIIKFHSE